MPEGPVTVPMLAMVRVAVTGNMKRAWMKLSLPESSRTTVRLQTLPLIVSQPAPHAPKMPPVDGVAVSVMGVL